MCIYTKYLINYAGIKKKDNQSTDSTGKQLESLFGINEINCNKLHILKIKTTFYGLTFLPVYMWMYFHCVSKIYACRTRLYPCITQHYSILLFLGDDYYSLSNY